MRPSWLVDMAQAMRDEVADWTRSPSVEPLGSVVMLGHAIRATLPYRYPEGHRPATTREALARGYAQCADAAVIVGARAYLLGDVDAWLCIEAPDELAGRYTHVRTMTREGAVDPYVAERADVPASCEYFVAVVDLVEAPLAAIELAPIIERDA